MTRLRFAFIPALATFVALVAATSGQAAPFDTFYSGRVANGTDTFTVDPLAAGQGANKFGISSGFSFTNLDPATGIVTAVGFANVPTYNVNSIAGDSTINSGGNHLVGVYALQGKFTGSGTTLSADFQPTAGPGGNGGVVKFYSLAAAPNASDPNTWVKAGTVANVATGLQANTPLISRPDAIAQGPPGSPATDQVLAFNPALFNTATTNSGQPGLTGNAQVKVGVDPGSSLFDFTPAGFNVDPTHPSFLIAINEALQNGSTFAGMTAANQLALSTLFANLFPGHSFIQAGDTYNPTTLGANGDVEQSIIGNFLIPGSEVSVTQTVPEPASMLVWGLVMGSGVVGGVRRWRMKKA